MLEVIKTLHRRCQTLCFSEEAKLQERGHLLSMSGYIQSAWNTATAQRNTQVSNFSLSAWPTLEQSQRLWHAASESMEYRIT